MHVFYSPDTPDTDEDNPDVGYPYDAGSDSDDEDGEHRDRHGSHARTNTENIDNHNDDHNDDYNESNEPNCLSPSRRHTISNPHPQENYPSTHHRNKDTCNSNKNIRTTHPNPYPSCEAPTVLCGASFQIALNRSVSQNHIYTAISILYMYIYVNVSSCIFIYKYMYLWSYESFFYSKQLKIGSAGRPLASLRGSIKLTTSYP